MLPHAPLQAPKRYIDGYAGIANRNRRIYAAMVEAMDDAVGAILAALEAEGMAGDTLIVWADDNGGAARFGADKRSSARRQGRLFRGRHSRAGADSLAARNSSRPSSGNR